MADLNKQASYTFIINNRDVQIIPTGDYIYLKETRNTAPDDKVVQMIPTLPLIDYPKDNLDVPIVSELL